MEKQPRHRLHREFTELKRLIVDCELTTCPICGEPLKSRRPWHMHKTVQTMKGPLFLVGKSKECVNPACPKAGKHYYASQVWLISLPKSTYGLDVLAFIGWEHEHAHRQLVEIQRELNGRGMLVNERNVGKLYRQFLALLGAVQEPTRRKLEGTVAQYGGVIWAIDALQPEGHGSLLYVLYEVISGTPVGAIQLEHLSANELAAWLGSYQEMLYPVLATLSDGEEMIEAALRNCWPQAPHQHCQAHFLSNLAEAVIDDDDELRQDLRNGVGGLPAVPKNTRGSGNAPQEPKKAKKKKSLP
jgi:hypothetical protein